MCSSCPAHRMGLLFLDHDRDLLTALEVEVEQRLPPGEDGANVAF